MDFLKEQEENRKLTSVQTKGPMMVGNTSIL